MLIYTPRMDLICDYLCCLSYSGRRNEYYWLLHELFEFITIQYYEQCDNALGRH